MEKSLKMRRTGPFLALSGQWFLYFLANIVVAPVLVGHAFDLSGTQTAALLQRTMILTGALSLAQAWRGHRWPLIEGPAGLWWSVFLTIGAGAASAQQAHLFFGDLRVGLVAAGVLLLLLSVFRGLARIQTWFTPTVTSVFLMLLSIQLTILFLPGLLSLDGAHVDPLVTGVDFLLMAAVVWINTRGPAFLKPYGVLFGMAVGWLIFAGLHWAPRPIPTTQAVSWPFAGEVPWGTNIGIIVTCLVTGIVNITNTVASLKAMASTLENVGEPEPLPPSLFDRANLGSGLANIAAGWGAAVGMVSFTASSALVQIARRKGRYSFMMAAAALAAAGFFPPITDRLAALPVSVGDTVLLVAYSQMLGLGLSTWSKEPVTTGRLYRTGIPMALGAGLMTLPATFFSSLPAGMRTLSENGLVIGVLLALIMEQARPRKTSRPSPPPPATTQSPAPFE